MPRVNFQCIASSPRFSLSLVGPGLRLGLLRGIIKRNCAPGGLYVLGWLRGCSSEQKGHGPFTQRIADWRHGPLQYGKGSAEL